MSKFWYFKDQNIINNSYIYKIRYFEQMKQFSKSVFFIIPILTVDNLQKYLRTR